MPNRRRITVRYTLFEQRKDELILLGRVLLMILFLLFGWSKLTDFSGTVKYMVAEGAPLPTISAIVSIIIELFIGIALVIGYYTRLLALLFALYVLGTGLIGHHYWTMPSNEVEDNMINFYKNISIMGGLLLLCVTGPGKYSVDGK
jgi:putative oxidoreductase